MPINQFSNVSYSWVPAGTSRPNNFTAQNVFKAATTTAPGFVAQGTGTISAIPAVDANAVGLFQGTEAVAGHVFFAASGQTTHVVFRRNNGTYASPTALAANDIIGSLQWQGRGASTFGSVPCAQIRGVAQQIFTETARGTALEFYVTANNTITQQLTLTIFPTVVSATVDMSSTGFTMTKTAGNARAVSYQTSSSNRWVLQANAVAEGGSNAGSNFEIRRYSDAAADLGAALTITRSTGAAAFQSALTSGVVALTDGATIALDASLGNHFRVTLAGNRTLNAPTNPVDGQYIRIEVIQDATGTRTLTLTTGALGFAFGTDIPSITLTTTANARDFIECVYNSTSQRWYVVRFVKGY